MVEMGEGGFVRAVALGMARFAIGQVLPGEELQDFVLREVGGVAARVGFDWLAGQAAESQQAAIDGLAAMEPEIAAAAAEQAFDDALGNPGSVGIELSESRAAVLSAMRGRVVDYCAVIPHAVREGTRRAGDGGVTRTLVTQLPRNEMAMAQFLPKRPPAFRRGEAVAGQDLVLEQLLGQGGFGEVWKARNPLMPNAKPVAVKYCLDPEIQASLRREMQMFDMLKADGGHPNIVDLVWTSYTSQPPYLVFDYVAGGDLAGWVASAAGVDGSPPSVSAVLAVLAQAAAGLAFAHQRGVVHRDIKPANILVDADGTIKVADFGIGALAPDQAASTPLAHVTGMTQLSTAYSPTYADPGRDPKRPDPQEDVFALGVIGVQLLAGDVHTAIPRYWDDQLDDQGVPAEVIALLRRCQSAPGRRYADGAALAAAIAAVAGRSSATVSAPKSEAEREPPAPLAEAPAPAAVESKPGPAGEGRKPEPAQTPAVGGAAEADTAGHRMRMPKIGGDDQPIFIQAWLKVDGALVKPGDSVADLRAGGRVVRVRSDKTGVLKIVVPAGGTGVAPGTHVATLLPYAAPSPWGEPRSTGDTTVSRLFGNMGKWLNTPTATGSPRGPVGAGTAGQGTADRVSLTLVDPGGRTAEVVKTVRAVTGLGAAEATALIAAAPTVLVASIDRARAPDVVKRFSDVGARVEMSTSGA